MLEVSESPRKVLDEIDGLLLTGGGDVDPVLYGEDRHPPTEDAEPGRDEFEIDLARRAMAGDLPLLAICRGAQVLNVAAGGTLVQDIPSLVTGLAHASSSRRTPTRTTSRSRRVPGSNGARRPRRRRAAAASTAGTISRSAASARVSSLSDRARRRRRSHRKATRTPRSASACSGTRRTSGGPASSRRCSLRSWARRDGVASDQPDERSVRISRSSPDPA